jgi:hypothetical protein
MQDPPPLPPPDWPAPAPVVAPVRPAALSPLAVDSAPAWPAGLELLALLQVDAQSVARALGLALQLARSSPPMQYYIGRFAQGPFVEADLRLNTERGNAFLVLRGPHLPAGLVPGLEFAGFDFHVPGGPHPLHQRIVPAPPGRSRPLRVGLHQHQSGGLDVLSFEWAPLDAAMPPSLEHADAAPGRYTMVLARADDGQWLPAPPLALRPHQAVHLELQGLEAWPGLDQASVKRVRVVLDLLAGEQGMPAGASHARISLTARVVWAAPLAY